MSDGQDSNIRAVSGTATADSSSSAVSGKAVSSALTQDSSSSLVIVSVAPVVPPGSGAIQVNTSGGNIQVKTTAVAGTIQVAA